MIRVAANWRKGDLIGPLRCPIPWKPVFNIDEVKAPYAKLEFNEFIYFNVYGTRTNMISHTVGPMKTPKRGPTE